MGKVLANDLVRLKPKNPLQTLEIVLPLGVSVNKLYTFFRGKRQISKEGKKYIQTVVPVIMQCAKNQNWIKDELGVWHIVEVTYYFPDKRRRDSHNYLKLLMDVLEGIAFENDQFCIVQEQYVYLDRKNPRLEVKIKHLEER